MATFISCKPGEEGKWYPVREVAVVKDAHGNEILDKEGKPIVYDGPDRDAQRVLEDNGVEYLGQYYKENSETIQAAHEKHMSMDEFTQAAIYTDEVRSAHYDEHKDEIANHALPEKKSPKKWTQRSGGDNFAGSGHIKGGWGDPPYQYR